MMDYKGYIGDVKYDSEAHIFHGEVINTRDVITFQGKSVDEIEQAFQDSNCRQLTIPDLHDRKKPQYLMIAIYATYRIGS